MTSSLKTDALKPCVFILLLLFQGCKFQCSELTTISTGSAERLCLVDDETLHCLAESGGVVWRKSGDIGRLLKDGSIVCLGRWDDQIKRLGNRMDLGALSQVCGVF